MCFGGICASSFCDIAIWNRLLLLMCRRFLIIYGNGIGKKVFVPVRFVADSRFCCRFSFLLPILVFVAMLLPLWVVCCHVVAMNIFFSGNMSPL